MESKETGKIFGVGFQKTGTSTLREALKVLGYRVKDCSPRTLFPILRKDWNKVLKILKNFDAAEDTPWYYIYEDLDRLVPNSKFILTVREEESWYKSVARHIGDLRSPEHEWIYGRGKGLPKDYKENTLQVYTQHNLDVIHYFRDRPEDFLVMDFAAGDGWEKLCEFLGKDVPNDPFPHANNSRVNKPMKEGAKKELKFLRKKVRNNLKIKYLDLMKRW